MRVRQLQVFKTVLELGSATRAAHALGISQPAVSKLLAGLSQECGFDLFVRKGNRLEATGEALSLFQEVERLFVNVDHIERHAAAIRDMRVGLVAIAAFPAIATRALPIFLNDFTRKHPDMRLSLVARSGRLLVEHVAAGQVDVGIGLMTFDHPGINFESLGAIEAVCVMSPKHRLAKKKFIRAEDIDGEPFISLGSEDQSRFKIDSAFKGKNIHRKIVMEVHQSEAACAFAAQGAGIAMVEPFSASGFRADELKVLSFRPAVHFELWIMTPVYRPKSQLVTALIEEFRSFVGTFRSRPSKRNSRSR
jgi:DNA-binding transcriptional LysR family regulator